MKQLKAGDAVKFIDENRREHDALVTAVWENMTHGVVPPGCNLLYVSSNDEQRDQYGRQIERRSSVAHKDGNGAPGWVWYWPDEDPPVFRNPS